MYLREALDMYGQWELEPFHRPFPEQHTPTRVVDLQLPERLRVQILLDSERVRQAERRIHQIMSRPPTAAPRAAARTDASRAAAAAPPPWPRRLNLSFEKADRQLKQPSM